MNKEKLIELSDTLRGIAEGKEWQKNTFSGWKDAEYNNSPISMLESGFDIRLKPWSLPPPPEGYEWHRSDWTQEMLPDGYRPLLLGEVYVMGDEYIRRNGSFGTESYAGNKPISKGSCHRRTRRPLPQPKKPKKRVPLTADDIKSGDEFQRYLSGNVYQWVAKSLACVKLNDEWLHYDLLMRDDWKIRSIGETEWRPCYKEVDE